MSQGELLWFGACSYVSLGIDLCVYTVVARNMRHGSCSVHKLY